MTNDMLWKRARDNAYRLQLKSKHMKQTDLYWHRNNSVPPVLTFTDMGFGHLELTCYHKQVLFGVHLVSFIWCLTCPAGRLHDTDSMKLHLQSNTFHFVKLALFNIFLKHDHSLTWNCSEVTTKTSVFWVRMRMCSSACNVNKQFTCKFII